MKSGNGAASKTEGGLITSDSGFGKRSNGRYGAIVCTDRYT
ncbi:hypothetical protein [Paenibacillus artemisiicola]|nr:hypothetical protein [Paenibacillus artemisiicola]